MNLFDLIIFDFDGTLADSARGISACMKAAFESYGLPPPAPSAVRARIGLTLEEAIAQFTLDHAGVDIAAVARRYRELHATVAAPAVSLFPGTQEALSALRESGVRLAVVSQKVRGSLTQLLEQLCIDHYFALVLGSDDVTVTKPDAALYERHIRPQFSVVSRERVLVVGDTPTDLQFALNAGVRSCWASYGYGSEQACRALRPSYTIAGVTDITSVCQLRSR